MRETCKLPTRPLPSPVILLPIAVHPNKRCHTRVLSKNRQNPTELDKNRQKLVPARVPARAREANHPVGLPSTRIAPKRIGHTPPPSFPHLSTPSPHPSTSFPTPIYVIPYTRPRHSLHPSTSFPTPIHVIPYTHLRHSLHPSTSFPRRRESNTPRRIRHTAWRVAIPQPSFQ